MHNIGPCELHHGDMLAVVPTLGQVDHVICNPPYENWFHARVGRCRRIGGGPMVYRNGWNFGGIDDIRDDAARVMVAASGGWLLVFALTEGVYQWHVSIEAVGGKCAAPITWHKPNCLPQLNGLGPARACENMVVAWCGAGKSCWQAGGKRGFYTYNVLQKELRASEHPSEKPLGLMRELVRDFTKPGDTILDPFMGSGTTGVACIREGRRFIGIEENARYFDMACERLTAEVAQPSLFMPYTKPTQQKISWTFDE